jgi:hypothetical protein
MDRHDATVSCRRCRGPTRFLGTPGARRHAATSYATCLFECARCGIRYSNARNPEQRRAFAQRPAGNVPKEVATGLTEVLGRAINETNRRNKLDKFCAETSEDAVAWTVFRWLHQVGQAALVPSLCGLPHPQGPPSLLLWGAPAGGGEAEQIRRQYKQVSDALGETPRRRTEVDVVLVWDDLLLAIEVKYGSKNDRRSGRASRLRRYVRPSLFAVDAEAVDELGFYELARNWALGAALAEALDRRFVLVNLGPASLARDIDLLRPQLQEDSDRRVDFLSWPTLVDGIRAESSVPIWLIRYLEERRLSSPAMVGVNTTGGQR